jgi:hypothetical protein
MSAAMKATLLSLTAGLIGLTSAAFAGSPAAYVAHEWGTFTSVQGADGAQMVWNPFIPAELPRFVYDRNNAFGVEMLLLKRNTSAKQRLETPVIYFHSPQALTVDVSIQFPQGSVTEWFPYGLVPKLAKPNLPALEWKGVKVVPRGSRAAKGLEAKIPREANGSHYYAAREATADYVIAPGKAKGKTEVEKLLFYRGIGNFDAPLMVTLPSSDEGRLLLLNTGTETLRDLFLVQVQDGKMAVTAVDDIAAQSSTTAEVGRPQPLNVARKELAAKLQAGLVRGGLYESEAAAMVKTWDDSWFAENGTRVLYVLPTAWADRVLPLTLTPAPREVARVFVGRAEVIMPTTERFLAVEVDRYSTDKATAVSNVRALGIGRFLEPTFRRLLAQHPGDEAFKTSGWELVSAANVPEKHAALSAR